MITVQARDLRRFYLTTLQSLGCPDETAIAGADGILYADLHGIDTHGALNFRRIYVQQLRGHDIDPSATPHVAGGTRVARVVDGRNALGYRVAGYAMDLALASAAEEGVGLVTVRNSSHCGCMGYYAKSAAERGFVALSLTNLGAQALLRPPRACQPLFGTNVVAAAAPTVVGQAPFVLDMSTAVTSAGQLRLRMARRESVPTGWLRDANGAAVADPARYFDGSAFLQFLGGSPELGALKGFGLALLVDVLCGVLADGKVGPDAHGSSRPAGARYDAGIGHCFVAIAPERVAGPGFEGRMSALLDAILACPTIDAKPLEYPGLREHRTAQQRALEGIPVADAVYEELCAVAAEVHVSAPSCQVGAA
jgi:LDH2 family malate/lactate/ureidoglycolate dehydrogenase